MTDPIFKKLQPIVKEILLHEWDPIGVANIPLADDEYDNYVPQVCKLLIEKSDFEKISDYLWKVETEQMGLPGNRDNIRIVSHKLLEAI